jgi:hypothetical protein
LKGGNKDLVLRGVEGAYSGRRYIEVRQTRGQAPTQCRPPLDCSAYSFRTGFRFCDRRGPKLSNEERHLFEQAPYLLARDELDLREGPDFVRSHLK